jgi:hypothetical protein
MRFDQKFRHGTSYISFHYRMGKSDYAQFFFYLRSWPNITAELGN